VRHRNRLIAGAGNFASGRPVAGVEINFDDRPPAGSFGSLQGLVESDIMSPVKAGWRGATMKRLSGGRLARLVSAGVTVSGLALTPVRADVLVQIDKSSRRMVVSVDGAVRYEWPVST
jgi:hypothetical protein